MAGNPEEGVEETAFQELLQQAIALSLGKTENLGMIEITLSKSKSVCLDVSGTVINASCC